MDDDDWDDDLDEALFGEPPAGDGDEYERFTPDMNPENPMHPDAEEQRR
jgi:hypothetical protein